MYMKIFHPSKAYLAVRLVAFAILYVLTASAVIMVVSVASSSAEGNAAVAVESSRTCDATLVHQGMEGYGAMVRTVRLYLIRHGETESNYSGHVLGQRESPLTEKGHEQARLAGTSLSGVYFWRSYSSDLHRAEQTAKYILSANGKESDVLRIDSRLRERAKGVREGRHKSLSREECLTIWEKENNGVNLPFEEDDDMVWKRFVDWLQSEVLRSVNESAGSPCETGIEEKSNVNILVVSHSGTIRIILNKFKKIIEQQEQIINEENKTINSHQTELVSKDMTIPNTSISVVDISINASSLKNVQSDRGTSLFDNCLISFKDLINDNHLLT